MHTLLDSSRGYAFGEAIYPNGGSYGPLQNSYLTLLIIHEGAARVSCDGTETVLERRGCGFFHNADSLRIEYLEGRRTHVGWCEGAPAGEVSASASIRLKQFPAQVALSPRLEALQRMGIELGSGSSSNLNALRNALGQAIFLAYFHDAQISEQERLIPRSVLRARLYIEENFEKEITVERLAGLVGVTPQHLVSAFRRHLGITPVRYLWQRRAARGHTLLLQTGLTLSEIAYQCGYKNPFHFSRQITQQFGMSPREVRANKGYRVPSDVAEGAADTAYGLALPDAVPAASGTIDGGVRP